MALSTALIPCSLCRMRAEQVLSERKAVKADTYSRATIVNSRWLTRAEQSQQQMMTKQCIVNLRCFLANPAVIGTSRTSHASAGLSACDLPGGLINYVV